MTFLNPLVLLGLAAAAIPLILHLLNRRKLRTVEFSTLRFLKELQHSSLRRLKLRQLLLLIIRTLLIITLVFAFARPALRGPFAGMIGGQANSSMVIIVDDSPSMTVRNERGMLFEQAREAAKRLLELASEGDRIRILPLSSLHVDSTSLSYDLPKSARTELERLRPSQIATPFSRLFPPLHQLLETSREANREVYIISDCQATQFAEPIDSVENKAIFEPGVQFFLLQTAAGPQQNAGVSSVEVESRILAQNRPAQAKISIRNFGKNPLQQVLVSIYLDGARIVQQTVDIAGQSAATLTPAIIPKRTGVLAGYVQLEDDAMEADNTRSFVVTIPEKITVTAVGPVTPETRFPLLALTLGKDSLITDRLTVLQTTPDKMLLTDLGRSDVLLLYGVSSLSPAQGTAIAAYVQRGGGLIIFPGKDLQATSYNESFWKPLNLPGWDPTLTVDSIQGNPSSFVSFSTVDYAHPIFHGLFEQSQLQKQGTPAIESPHVWRTVGMKADARGISIITLSNGEAFLSEYRKGEGRILAFAVEPGTQWSDFPLKGIFVPLIHRAVTYLASPAEADTTVTVGSRVQFSLRSSRGDVRTRYIVTSPSGIEERVAPHARSGDGTIEFESSPSAETGVFSLKAEETGRSPLKILAARAVVLPESEGDLRPATEDELASFWRRHGIESEQVRLLAADGALERTIQESRFGVEFWKYLLVIAAALAAAEMLIGREGRHKEG